MAKTNAPTIKPTAKDLLPDETLSLPIDESGPETKSASRPNSEAKGRVITTPPAKLTPKKAAKLETVNDSPTPAKEGHYQIGSKPHPQARWYVVHTTSGHEMKIALTLRERVESAGFADRINEILVPTRQKIVISEGKKRHVNERIFPGYILVKMVMSDKAWYIVRSTGGVTGFVGAGARPTPLSPTEVESILKFTKLAPAKFEAKFKEGDAVKITSGPFQDFIGKVEEVNDSQGKVKVLVSVFGRETPVELDFVQVSPL